MKRRNRAVLVAMVALGPALAASDAPAQPARKTFRIGWLDSGRVSAGHQDIVKEAVVGYPQSMAFEYRSADGRGDRLHEMAAELVGLKVDLVFAVGNPAIQAARQATSTIPIVMLGSDAVGTGVVARLEEPTGNVTGVTYSSQVLSRERLRLLKALRPSLARVAVLQAAADPASRVELLNLQAAAETAGVKVQSYAVPDSDSFAGLFGGLAERAEAVVVPADPLTLLHLPRIVELANRSRVPAVYVYREFVEAGGLLAYGPSLPAMYRRAGAYIGRIASGAKPRELPIDQPSRFELVVNLKTAKALGVTVPEAVLVKADHIVK